MSDLRARYIGDPDGAEITVPLGNEQHANIHVAHGAEVPAQIEGHDVPKGFLRTLLEQPANWAEVKRATGDGVKGKAADKPTDTKKEG